MCFLNLGVKGLTLSIPRSTSTEVGRIGSVIISHLSKLWKFFKLCDVIFLVRLPGEFEIDHSWECRRTGLIFDLRTQVYFWMKLTFWNFAGPAPVGIGSTRTTTKAENAWWNVGLTWSVRILIQIWIGNNLKSIGCNCSFHFSLSCLTIL